MAYCWQPLPRRSPEKKTRGSSLRRAGVPKPHRALPLPPFWITCASNFLLTPSNPRVLPAFCQGPPPPEALQTPCPHCFLPLSSPFIGQTRDRGLTPPANFGQALRANKAGDFL